VQHTDRRKSLVSRSHIIFYIFSAAVFILCFYYFSEIKSGFQQLKKVKVSWLALAIAAQLITYLFAAIIYRALLRAFKVRQLPPLLDLFQASVIFLFFNQTVPSVGISGNTFFFNFLVKRNVPITQAIAFMTTELLIFYVTMAITCLCLLVVCFFLFKASAVFLAVLAVGGMIHLVLAIIVLWIRRKESLDFLYRKIKKLKFIRKYIDRVRQQFQPRASKNYFRLLLFLKRNKTVVLKVFLSQLVILVADAFTLLALFYGLGVAVPVFAVLLSFICTRIIATLPISPGSLILYESSMTFFLASLGTPVGPAVVVTLLYRLLSFWFPIPVGLFLYKRWLQSEGS
jgi:hypothetical protein